MVDLWPWVGFVKFGIDSVRPQPFDIPKHIITVDVCNALTLNI